MLCTAAVHLVTRPYNNQLLIIQSSILLTVLMICAAIVESPPPHGGLLSLNAWKLGPTPQNIEVVASPHSNEPSNRCPLEPAVHEVHET